MVASVVILVIPEKLQAIQEFRLVIFALLVIAILRRSLGQGRFWQILVETGQITVSVLFLVMAASFFSRMLAMSGLPAALGDLLLSGPVGP